MGAENSVVLPNVEINGVSSNQIEGGAIRGANLFHSFREFNIGEGRGAYFTNPAGIENLTTQGVFGLQFREEQTPCSDITASSEFGVDGTVEINTLEADPSQGLVSLPTEVVDVSGLIAQSCLG